MENNVGEPRLEFTKPITQSRMSVATVVTMLGDDNAETKPMQHLARFQGGDQPAGDIPIDQYKSTRATTIHHPLMNQPGGDMINEKESPNGTGAANVKQLGEDEIIKPNENVTDMQAEETK